MLAYEIELRLTVNVHSTRKPILMSRPLCAKTVVLHSDKVGCAIIRHKGSIVARRNRINLQSPEVAAQVEQTRLRDERAPSGSSTMGEGIRAPGEADGKCNG